MSILDNYYGEGKSIRDKITELEQENKKLEEENKKLKTIIESIMKKYNMKEIGMGDEIIMKRYE